MAFWKQAILAVLLVGGGLLAWLLLAPASAPPWLVALAERTGANAIANVERTSSAGPRPGRRGGGADGPVQVLTATVSEEASGNRVQAIGTGEAVRSVTLHPQSNGMVAEVRFRSGGTVKEGDLVLRLDDADQRIAVEQARIKLKTAQDTVTRYERLGKSQAIAAVQIEQARDALQQARSELEAAEINLERRSVTAPFDGVIGFVSIDVGDLVTTTTAIGEVDDRSQLFVDFVVPERYAALVAEGKEIRATAAAFGDEVFAGQVDSIASRVDPSARTLRVRARLPNDDDRLRPGMSFLVELSFAGTRHPAVPAVAVQWDRAGAFVWKVVEGKARRVPVRVVERRGDTVLVEGELRPSEDVVAEGVLSLREGTDLTLAGEAPAGTRL